MNVVGFGVLATLGPIAFAALVWGAVALVVAVFVYVAATYAREYVRNGEDDGARGPSDRRST